jgi:hypothetical protein
MAMAQNVPQFEVVDSPVTRRRREIFSHRKETTGKYAEAILLLEAFAQHSGVKKADVWKEVLPALVDAALKSGALDIYVEADDEIRRLKFEYDDVDEFLVDARTWDFGNLDSKASKESKETKEAAVVKKAVVQAEEPKEEDKSEEEDQVADLDLNLDIFSQAKK